VTLAHVLPIGLGRGAVGAAVATMAAVNRDATDVVFQPMGRCSIYRQRHIGWNIRSSIPFIYHIASSETHWLQTSAFCLLVFVWSRTSVPRRRHTSRLQKSSTAATPFHQQIVCRSTHTQHIRRQELRCRRATCLEQSSGPLARRGHYVRRFQAWTQNILF